MKVQKILARRYRQVGMAAGAALVASPMAMATVVTPVYEFTGAEFDANKAALTIILTLAAAVCVGFVAIGLLKRGGRKV